MMSSRSRPDWVSPSLAAIPNGEIPAFEMKFFVPELLAREVEAWAIEHLTLDPHADPSSGNSYTITTAYFDTPRFDAYQRVADYRRDKYRVRRYGTDATVHLERKSKENDRVWKVRTSVPLAAVSGVVTPSAGWFATELADLELRPVCRVTYNRTAFVGLGCSGPLRVTLDRNVVGSVRDTIDLDPIATAVPIVTDGVILEFKYLATLPALFKGAYEQFRLTPAGVSKYRRCVAATGLVSEGTGDA